MTLKIANTEFESVTYDDLSDVLYLRVPDSGAEVLTRATAEGHAISWDVQRRIIGIAIVNAKWLLDRDGEITLTERVPASTIAPALT